MKLLIILFCSICSFQQVDKTQIRELYKVAHLNAEKTEELYAITKDAVIKENEALLKVYYGAALTLKAKFAKTRKDKIKFFKEGAKLIEEVVAKHPNDIEIRFVRLSVQENAPRITRYKKNIKEDKLYIEQNLQNSSEQIKVYIAAYFENN
ncbi:hypothetical protein [Aquimarina rhabdastrellae]